MADAYRHIAQRLNVDFSASIRLLELLPVFLHGEQHKIIRKELATVMARNRSAQELAGHAFIEGLDKLLTPEQPIEWMSGVVQPLWRCMNGLEDSIHDDRFGFIMDVTRLFSMKTTLRERLRINAWIERFIALDERNATERLIDLSQGVLGFTPFSASLTLSMHHLLQQNMGRRLCDIDYPALYPRSAVQTTDRYQPNAPSDSAAQVVRCVLHASHRTTEQNNSALYGVGEHVCLGRPLANALWSMFIAKLSRMPNRVLACSLVMERPEPVSHEDYLHVIEPFQRPASLCVTFSA